MKLSYKLTAPGRYEVRQGDVRLGVVRRDRHGWWWAIAPTSDTPPYGASSYGPYSNRAIAGRWLVRIRKWRRAEGISQAASNIAA